MAAAWWRKLRAASLALLLFATGTGLFALGGVDKVTICHVPPGNPGNAHTITVGAPAVDAHLAHGDSLGACADDQEPENEPPVADAGTDQLVYLGAEVVLDGSASFDPDGDPLTYLWTLVSAPAGAVVELSDPAAVSPSFLPEVPGEYVFSLVVNDGEFDSEPDFVTILVAVDMILELDPSVIGVGQTAAGTVTLRDPAPSGGLVVTLEVDEPAVASVDPAEVQVPEGETVATVTVVSAAVGHVTVTASAFGVPSSSAELLVLAEFITIESPPTLLQGGMLELVVRLSNPAPTGGVELRLETSAPQVAVVTPVVTVPAGEVEPATGPMVTGLFVGVATITATAPGHAPGRVDVEVRLLP